MKRLILFAAALSATLSLSAQSGGHNYVKVIPPPTSPAEAVPR